LTFSYLRDIVEGRKKLLKNSQVNGFCVPPKLPGLSVEQIWRKVKQDTEIASFFPDYKSRLPCKKYLFKVKTESKKILSTIRPEIVASIVKQIQSQQKKTDAETEPIKVTSDFKKLIKKADGLKFGKRQKVLSLMKAKKRKKSKKLRKKYEINIDLSQKYKKSSGKRTKRSKVPHQQPESFMDEEIKITKFN
jgi:hypothetical protein